MSRSTLRSSFAISVAVMASRVLGVVREAVFVALFPRMLTDAYGVAFRIPNLLRDLFAEGALSSAFVPTFTAALEKDGKPRAFRLGNLVMTGLVLTTGALVAAGLMFAPAVVGLIAGGFDGNAEKEALTVGLTSTMMPILTLVSVGAAWMGMLNAQSHFVAPAFAPAMFNVTSILCGISLLAAGLDNQRGLYLFSAATVLSAAVQTLVQLPALWRLGYRPQLAVAGLLRDPGVRRIVRLMAPAVIGLAAVQINIFVNTRFASLLGDGPVTYLNNAFRLFYLPVGVFGVALATVTTTRVSQEAARGDRVALLARNAEGLRGVWMLASASGVGLVLLAQPVVTFLFERGRFDHDDVLATARVLQMYMLGVLPYSLVKNLAPAFYAIGRPRLPMLASMLAVAANVIFNATTYERLGAPGLALGTTLGAVVNYLVLRVAYGRLVGSPVSSGWARHALALLLGNGVLAAVVLAMAWGGERLVAGVPGQGVPGGAWLLATIVAAFFVYTRVLAALAYPGAQELAGLPGKLLGRLRRR